MPVTNAAQSSVSPVVQPAYTPTAIKVLAMIIDGTSTVNSASTSSERRAGGSGVERTNGSMVQVSHVVALQTIKQ